MSKKMEFGQSAREKMMIGVSALARAVKATMGPRGRNVVIQRKGQTPHVTKDGVTVAKSISFKDAYQESGALLVKQVAQKTADVAGDGPQPLWSKVLTPQGFVEMRDIKVGMTISGTNGTTQTVSGIFPKGVREIVEVVLADGRMVECCEAHLWTVKTFEGDILTLTTSALEDLTLQDTPYFIPIEYEAQYDKDFKIFIPPTGDPNYSRIKSITRTGSFTEMQCIKVSNPDHLYITDNYVVTHNTTTSTVLAEAIMREGSKLVAAGHDPMAIKRGMDKACDFVVDFVKSESRPVETDEEVCQVGTISANGDLEIGQMVSSAIAQVGKSGIITLEESSSPETVLRIGSGYEFDRGYITNYFCNDPVRQRVVLRDALVLLVEGTLAGTLMLKEIMPLLEHVSNHAQSLVVIAENIEGEILNTLAVNVAKGALKVVAIKAPGYGSARTEMLKDLGALVGATVLDGIPGTQLQRLVTEEGQLDLSLLGFTPSIEVYADRSVIISNPDSTDAVDARVSVLRAELAQVTDIHDREMLDKRLAKMVGGLASIEVGAATEAEMKEKKDRLEDALAATRAAIQEGVVAGGGVALARAASALKTFSTGNKEEDVGKEVIREAIKVPLWQIATNAGEKGDVIVEAVMASSDPSFGFDAAKLRYGDMFSFGIIDPAKVTRVALQNAVSIAGLVLTTEAVVAFEDDEK